MCHSGFVEGLILFFDYSKVFMYRVSYLWYVLIGMSVTCIIGLIVSFLTRPNDPRDVDPNLLAPIVRRHIKPRQYPNQPHTQDIILAYEPVSVLFLSRRNFDFVFFIPANLRTEIIFVERHPKFWITTISSVNINYNYY